MKKWNSRILFMALGSLASVLAAVLADGVVTSEELWGLVAAAVGSTGSFAYVNREEKKAGSTDA